MTGSVEGRKKDKGNVVFKGVGVCGRVFIAIDSYVLALVEGWVKTFFIMCCNVNLCYRGRNNDCGQQWTI